MVKKLVHNSRARTEALVGFILENACGHRSAFDVSDVKSDGTVFVRFKSTPHDSSMFVAEEFSRALSGQGLAFLRVDDNKFRLALDQFQVVTGSV